MPVVGIEIRRAQRQPACATLAAAWRPYLETIIDSFGPSRCMFESNFPVDKLSVRYDSAWNAFKRFAAVYSSDERPALFHDVARAVYRLD
jgi:L-fuconolactonase